MNADDISQMANRPRKPLPCTVGGGGPLDCLTQGSVEQFRENWQRHEAQYCHFTRGEPVNQIQFAFRQNWLEFAKIMEPLKPWDGKKSLEVGAGRGTMSMYFADNGFDCTLLDACDEPLWEAARNFQAHDLPHPLYFKHDATKMPFEDGMFDVVFSYGLLEHFDDIMAPLREQVRVLKQGGVLIAYVVPTAPNARDEFRQDRIWSLVANGKAEEIKSPVHRNGYSSGFYKQAFHEIGLQRLEGEHPYSVPQWVYPFPLFSKSGDFPFTLNPPEIEIEIVGYLKGHSWATSGYGQAFIVWGWNK